MALGLSACIPWVDRTDFRSEIDRIQFIWTRNKRRIYSLLRASGFDNQQVPTKRLCEVSCRPGAAVRRPSIERGIQPGDACVPNKHDLKLGRSDMRLTLERAHQACRLRPPRAAQRRRLRIRTGGRAQQKSASRLRKRRWTRAEHLDEVSLPLKPDHLVDRQHALGTGPKPFSTRAHSTPRSRSASPDRSTHRPRVGRRSIRFETTTQMPRRSRPAVVCRRSSSSCSIIPHHHRRT